MLSLFVSKANTGQMDDPDKQWTMLCSNLALIQVTSISKSPSFLSQVALL